MSRLFSNLVPRVHYVVASKILTVAEQFDQKNADGFLYLWQRRYYGNNFNNFIFPVPPLFVIEFLHRVHDTFEDYFSECTESNIKENYVIVYEVNVGNAIPKLIVMICSICHLIMLMSDRRMVFIVLIMLITNMGSSSVSGKNSKAHK